MKYKIRVIIMVALIIISNGYIFAGGQGEKETEIGSAPVTLTVAIHNPPEGSIGQKLQAQMDAFMEMNPNVTLEYVYLPFQDMAEIVVTQLVGGKAPSLVRAGNTMGVRDWIEKGWFASTPADVTTDLEENFAKSAVDAVTFFGKTYGYPAEFVVCQTIINTKIYDDSGLPYPDSYPEMIEQQPKLTKKDSSGRTVQFGVVLRPFNPHWSVVNFMPILWSRNGDFFTPDYKKVVSDSPMGVQALKDYGDLVYPELPYLGAYDVFGAGTASAMICGQFWAPHRANKDVAPYIKTMSVPKGFNGKREAFGYAWTFLVNASLSKAEQRLAWDYLKFAFSDEPLWVLASADYLPLARKSHFQRWIDEGDKWIPKWIDALQYIRPFNPPKVGEVYATWTRELGRFVSEGQTAEQTMASVKEQFEKILQ